MHPPLTHHHPGIDADVVPDFELFLVLTIVTGILVLQLLAVLIALRRHNVRDKAKWKRLREDGVVIVSGPAMAWVNEAPPRATFSTFNLRQTLQTSSEQVAP
jgi:hypothetical protein